MSQPASQAAASVGSASMAGSGRAVLLPEPVRPGEREGRGARGFVVGGLGRGQQRQNHHLMAPHAGAAGMMEMQQMLRLAMQRLDETRKLLERALAVSAAETAQKLAMDIALERRRSDPAAEGPDHETFRQLQLRQQSGSAAPFPVACDLLRHRAHAGRLLLSVQIPPSILLQMRLICN
jgi:hypothetical protein